jgi:pimeloyl-ACP methyl ester carboxylesterase
LGSDADTRYAKHGDVHVAYQVIGTGPIDVVVMPTWATNVEAIWDDPAQAQLLDGLSAFGRVILFDKRGIGLSDPVPLPHLPTLEEWLDDLLCVMDAADSKRAALVAADVAGFIALLAASTFPDRTSALVLVNSAARVRRAADYPAGLPDHLVEPFLQRLVLQHDFPSCQRGDSTSPKPVRSTSVFAAASVIVPPRATSSRVSRRRRHQRSGAVLSVRFPHHPRRLAA